MRDSYHSYVTEPETWLKHQAMSPNVRIKHPPVTPSSHSPATHAYLLYSIHGVPTNMHLHQPFWTCLKLFVNPNVQNYLQLCVHHYGNQRQSANNFPNETNYSEIM